jgi:cobyrinic acid a,c-diamide synthase
MSHALATTAGLIIAAPATGAGKTSFTLGLLRALATGGRAVAPAKIGPDYIDPKFHEAATGTSCVNLDGWAMRPALLAYLVAGAGADRDLVIAEGVMGLFDGGAGAGQVGHGSSADLARFTGWPVLLVVDAARIAQSAAAMVHGFAGFDPDIHISGVVFNKVAGERHEQMLRAAMARPGLPPVLGCLPRAELSLPSRHLGLVQASENGDLERFIAGMAELVSRHCELEAIAACAAAGRVEAGTVPALVPPPGQRPAIARDRAFEFTYPHLISGWRRAGAEVTFFSPLANEAPPATADAVFLPGGYPELHAGRLAAADGFLEGLRASAGRGAAVYGECGGYMVLGAGLTDRDGVRHAMAGLLGLETSFAVRRLHLGYRRMRALEPFALGRAGALFRGHEFHYSCVVREEGAALFGLEDGRTTGLRHGAVAGSFLHVIDLDGA